MSSKQLKFDTAAQKELRAGVEQIARAVALTMGPTGRNVVMQKSFGGPAVTKDGVSVAKEIDLPQPFENMGAKMIREVAKKTADLAGDGTTCATVLAHRIFSDGLRHVTVGASPMAVQRGINGAAPRRRSARDAATSRRSPPSPRTTTSRSARPSPRRSTRSAPRASSRSRKARPPRPRSTTSRAWRSTRAS